VWVEARCQCECHADNDTPFDGVRVRDFQPVSFAREQA
jgi:hypothetical protein